MEIQIISGFLGAGKTTFLNQYIGCLPGKTAIIENEFGDVGLDGVLLASDIPVREINAGCICCTLAVDFLDGIVEIIEKFQPDQILIEPSGVAKLSEIVRACERVKQQTDIEITKKITIVDITCCEEYIQDFGMFYSDQIMNADLILLSHIDEVNKEERDKAIDCIREVNTQAFLYDGDWRKLEKEELLFITQQLKVQETIETAENAEFHPVNQMFSQITLEENGAMEEKEIRSLLEGMKTPAFGNVLRLKGIVPAVDEGFWEIHFTGTTWNYFRRKQNDLNVNRIIVIGCGLNKKELRKFVYSFGEE